MQFKLNCSGKHAVKTDHVADMSNCITDTFNYIEILLVKVFDQNDETVCFISSSSLHILMYISQR